MTWQCPPLHLLNWNNSWKWRTEMKKNIKVEAYAWIAETGALQLGFYFGDSDEPICFETPLKQIVRETLSSYCLINGKIHKDELHDVERLYQSLISAANIVKHEIKRFEETND